MREIMEFAPREQTHLDLPHNGNPGAVSQEDGRFGADQLAKLSTRYPWHFADRIADDLLARMILRGKTSGAPDTKPHVLALWDAVGIAHELNAWRNEAAGRIKQFGDERELQITAMNAIEGVKQALENKAANSAREAAEIGLWKWTAGDSAERLKNVQQHMPQLLARNRDLCRRWEQDAVNKMPAHIVQQRQYAVAASDEQWLRHNADIDTRLDQYKNHRDPQSGKTPGQLRDERSRRLQNEAIAEAWPKYEKKLQPGAQVAFRQKYETFLDEADKIIDARTVTLIKWLEAPPCSSIRSRTLIRPMSRTVSSLRMWSAMQSSELHRASLVRS